MEHIFGDDTDYSQETVEQLKQVMLLSELNDEDTLIYGKTGMGKDYGITVDSWFTGFCESGDKKVYFCVYLGKTDGQSVSSTKAKEIAINIVHDYMN